MKKTAETKFFGFWMNNIVHGELKAYCKANGQKLSWVAEQAIKLYVNKGKETANVGTEG